METIERVRTINDFASQLSEFEQEELIKTLKKRVLIVKANLLDASVLPNIITMEEITNEVHAYRNSKKK